MPGIKICIIGAASHYMTSMFSSIASEARNGRLADSEIALYDIDEENLKLMHGWGRAGALNDGLNLEFSSHKELDTALDGADFVLSCIRCGGGLDGRYIDETVPEKYGLLGNETVGLGGIFMGLRTVPTVFEIAGRIRKKCPSAWLINYTNPTNMATDASIRAGHERSIGLCDGVYGVKWLACKLLGISPKKSPEIEALVSGVNHCTWCVRLLHGTQNVYDGIDGLIDSADLSGRAGYETIDETKYLNEVEADACRLYKLFGLLPGSVYYARYYYNLGKVFKSHGRPGHMERSRWLQNLAAEKRNAIRAQLKNGTSTILPHDVEDAAHGDQAIGAISAIANDTRKFETVNVINNGAVPYLPNDAIVETGAVLSAVGAIPLAAGDLPETLTGTIKSVWLSAKLTVDAALKRDKKILMQAAMAHPLHHDLDALGEAVQELFSAHKNHLGNLRSSRF